MQTSTEEEANRAVWRPASSLECVPSQMRRPHSSPQLRRPPGNQLAPVLETVADKAHGDASPAASSLRYSKVPSAACLQEQTQGRGSAGLQHDEEHAWPQPQHASRDIHERPKLQGESRVEHYQPDWEAQSHPLGRDSIMNVQDAKPPLWRDGECAESAARVLRHSTSFTHRGGWRNNWRPPGASQLPSKLDALVATTGAEMQPGRRCQFECAGTMWHDSKTCRPLLTR